MIVSKAGGTQATAQTAGASSLPNGASLTSYAPLYLGCNLRDNLFDIEELEANALDRLKMLKAIDQARMAAASGPKANVIKTIREAARAAERQYNLNILPSGKERDSRILKDEASHFLLRLAMCKTQEHRAWLLGLECELFAARLEGTHADSALSAIRKTNGPSVIPASGEEMEALRSELDAVVRGPCGIKRGSKGIRFFKVDFEQVPALVRSRKVLLKNGTAYVMEQNILDIVIGHFRMKMNQSLTVASRAVGNVEEDRRMRPILDSIREHHAADMKSGKGFDANQVERISLPQLEESIQSMPLCMRNMMAKLREQHHLRYEARLQLGVFLKGCGLTMDESLHFWRTEFGKGTIDSNKFEKAYAYNIRHHYGKEGKRRNLQPFACIKIINNRPGPGEHNGCPYREFEENTLIEAVRRMGADMESAKAITAKAREGNFQAACGMCFHSTQPPLPSVAEGDLFFPSHPNEYFIESRQRRYAPASQNIGTQDDGDIPMADLDEDPTQLHEESPARVQQVKTNEQPASNTVDSAQSVGKEHAAGSQNDAREEDDDMKRQKVETME